MTFNVIQMIPKDANFGRLWPVPAEDSASMLVEREESDGHSVLDMPVKTATVKVQDQGRFKNLVHMANLKDAWLYITDSRVIFAAANFNPGGGWSGTGIGFFVAETANAVSKARHRSVAKSTIVAGHIRYQWLRAVIAEPRWGIVPQTICLFYTPPDQKPGQGFHLALQLGRTGSWSLAAQAAIRRAAAFDLRNYDIPADRKAEMEQLTRAPEPVAKIKQIMPWSLVVSEANA